VCFSVSLDGRVEELDLLPESLGLFLQRGSLLLHLADVLCGLVQGGGLADLEPTHTQEALPGWRLFTSLQILVTHSFQTQPQLASR
jgi:hypothetical protein